MDIITDQQRIDRIAEHVRGILELIEGENPSREGLVDTPQRYAKALWMLTSGYKAQPEAVIGRALFEHEGSQMVVVKDIEFYSLCEHHVLPFFGTVSIGYIPDGKIVGLSKLARLVNAYARRLQVQERMTAQIADTVKRLVGAKGVIVLCTAEHLCMKMRGVQKQHAATTTMHYNGVFSDDAALRAEFTAALR